MDEEKINRAMELKEKSELAEKQLEMVEEEINLMENFLKDINKIKKDGEILVPLGLKVFARGKITSENLLVEIGKGVIVEKTFDETKEILKNQLGKFKNVRIRLKDDLEDYVNQLDLMIKELEKDGEQSRT